MVVHVAADGQDAGAGCSQIPQHSDAHRVGEVLEGVPAQNQVVVVLKCGRDSQEEDERVTARVRALIVMVRVLVRGGGWK